MEVRLTQSYAAPLEVLDCFERGRRTRRAAALPIHGPRIEHDGLWAAFSLAVAEGRVSEARFQAPACTTLIAYCQAAADLAPRYPVREAHRLDPQTLVPSLPGVPPARQDRARLAAAAWHAAAAGAAEPTDPQPENTR